MDYTHKNMVPEGVEPSTSALLAQRSNQLSYGTEYGINSAFFTSLRRRVQGHQNTILFYIRNVNFFGRECQLQRPLPVFLSASSVD